MEPRSIRALGLIIAVIFACGLVGPLAVVADEGAPPTAPAPAEAPPAAPEPTPAPVPTPAPAPQKDALDFDLFGDKGGAGASLPSGTQLARDPIAIARSVKRRRLILKLHQGIGFATLAVFAATIVLGQLNYVDKFGGGDYTNRYDTPHLALASTTAALFATDAILALAAPNPYPKPIRADAALLHKVMMTLAAAGMAAEIGLGIASVHKAGELDERNLALGHLVNGYVTFAAMATGYLAYVF